MFINLQTPAEIVLLILGLAVFGLAAWQRLDWGAALVLFCAPLYLLKIKVGWLPLSVLEVLILIILGIWLVRRTSQRENPPQPPFFKGGRRGDFWFLSILLILVGAVLSTIFSADLKVSAGIFKSWILEPMIFGFLLVDVIQTKKQLARALLALILSGLAVAVIGLGYLLAGRLTFDGRLAAFYLSPNHLAMYLAPAFILALGFWFWAKKLWQTILLVICYMLYVICLYFTYSYAAWLALFVSLFFALFFLGRYKIVGGKKLFIVYCLLFIVLLTATWSQLGSEKLGNLLTSERSSWQSRLMVWQAALKIGQDHWLVGIGPGLFQKYYLDYQKYFPVPYLEWAAPQPSNLFLAFWLQTGLVGLIGFLWLLVNFFRWTIGAVKKTKQPLVLILMAVMIYFLAHGLVDTTYWKNDLALIFWVVIALSYAAGLLKRE
jgi:O-antigen ligase